MPFMRLKNKAAAWAIFLLLFASAAFSSPLSAEAACSLSSPSSKIKRLIHIQFENLHLQRDDPAIPSDLERMPHLFSFLKEHGVLNANHHGVLSTQAATNMLSGISGLYPDRLGMPLAATYGSFNSAGSTDFDSAYAYWTARDNDGAPHMIGADGLAAPAPWTVFTRAGCDVGSFGVANLGVENLPGDAITLFGAHSNEAREAIADPVRSKADLLSIAIHCARQSALCANRAHAVADLLPQEAGGYTGFHAVFGNRHVQEAIAAQTPLRDLDGQIITDTYGNVGFPDAYGPRASQSLGYAASLLEAGVPVLYVFIADSFKQAPRPQSKALAANDAGYEAQLASYDAAFTKFLERLSKANITLADTLFIVTSDETDHYAGQPPQEGEIDVYLDRLMTLERQNVTRFDMSYGTAPAFYIHGNPSYTDPLARSFVQDLQKLTVTNPTTEEAEPLAAFVADRAAMSLLHLTPGLAARTPSFILFNKPDYYSLLSDDDATCNTVQACAVTDAFYAWNHAYGDPDKARGWLGLVGPGIPTQGLRNDVWSDQTDIRPTVLALLSLTDSYRSDGRLLKEFLAADSVPPSVAATADFVRLAALYKDLNAPLGSVGRNSLITSTKTMRLEADGAYEHAYAALSTFARQRERVASHIQALLDDASFHNMPFNPAQTSVLLKEAEGLIAAAQDLASGTQRGEL